MKRYVIAVDQSTSASKVFLVNAQGEIVRRFSKNHQQFYPQVGYVEHDAQEIWDNVCEGIRTVSTDLLADEIAALSISNQRETTILWDRETGVPVCNAIVWQDIRGEALCHSLESHALEIEEKTGLKLSAYYSAAKASSVLHSDPAINAKAKNGTLCIGTVDSYLIYRLTNGEVFQTDVSNASRTQLCNIHTLTWDKTICDLFGISQDCLAKIVHSDASFGKTSCKNVPSEILITGVMGDSHAALFGQGCLLPGMAKATFGTGSSVMMNIGETVIASQNGLSTSVGFGFDGSVCYVLEGNVTSSGDTLCWLRDELGLVDDIASVEQVAQSVSSTENVYLIPAFSGLGAPYFNGASRAALIGMNRSTTKAHIVRAALESIAYQDVDIIAAMKKDMGIGLSELHVDGGPANNGLLMQFLSDLLNCRVICAKQSELSALGVAYMAGISSGLFARLDGISAMESSGNSYAPHMDTKQREVLLQGWNTAIGRCL
ncbi:MAG: glycerol kinase GlpK [Clostridiales bacterium]|nr:glycerol kinase GlpK [Clostridiales bacterium]